MSSTTPAAAGPPGARARHPDHPALRLLLSNNSGAVTSARALKLDRPILGGGFSGAVLRALRDEIPTWHFNGDTSFCWGE